MEEEIKEIPFEEKVEEKDDSELDYKAKQKKYREMYKNRARWVWISKLPDREILGKKVKNPLNRGKTYIKKEHENDIMG